MRKTVFSILTAVMMIPFVSGFRMIKKENRSFCLFPELTFSNAVEFEDEDNEDKNEERIEVVEKNEKVKIKFKLFEWVMSVFRDS
ncbi:MAG: hypothetical protein E7509_05710 [Ruminococcus sp.]|nr:hypothetical protein [Ruminococcus sp.]